MGAAHGDHAARAERGSEAGRVAHPENGRIDSGAD